MDTIEIYFYATVPVWALVVELHFKIAFSFKDSEQVAIFVVEKLRKLFCNDFFFCTACHRKSLVMLTPKDKLIKGPHCQKEARCSIETPAQNMN